MLAHSPLAMNYYSSDLSYYGPRSDGSFYDQQQAQQRTERESPLAEPASGSSAAPYAGGYKDESDAADDPHLALTSQTLNADGTPKRPMNAFMIFARKRRPEISAANQMMRTGDVSKILSREWNTMEMPEKKFYLDQAKKLKDHFNARYPDYVYRRRPNNSRKKRKPDMGHDASADGSSSAEREDMGLDEAAHELDESVEDALLDYHHQYQLAQSSASVAHMNYGAAVQPHSLSGYHPPSSPFSSNRYDEKPTSLSQNRFSSSTSPPLTTGISGSPPTPGDLNAPSAWPFHRDGSRTGRVPLLPALDTGLARQRNSESDLAASMRQDATSPQMRSWGGGPYSTSSGSSGSSISHHTNSAFPTLTSPFVPAQSPSPRQAESLSSPMPHYSASQDYTSGQSAYAPRGAPSLGRPDGPFEHRGFTQSNVLPPPVNNAYPPMADQMAASWPSQYRSFPASHTNMSPTSMPMSSLPVQSSSPTASSPANPNAISNSLPHMGYIARDKFGR